MAVRAAIEADIGGAASDLEQFLPESSMGSGVWGQSMGSEYGVRVITHEIS